MNESLIRTIYARIACSSNKKTEQREPTQRSPEPRERQERHGLTCGTVERKVSENRSDDRRELETVSAEPGGDHDVCVRGMTIDQKMLVPGHRVHTRGMAHHFARDSRQSKASALENWCDVGLVKRPIEHVGIPNQLALKVFREF